MLSLAAPAILSDNRMSVDYCHAITKKARSSAKAVVTRKINEIIALMTNEGNVEEVNKKSGELLEAFDKFQAIHEAFHKELIDAESVRESEKYYQLVSGQVDLLLENLEIWLTGIEATRAVSSIEVRPEDSISNVGRRSRVSRSSHASNIAIITHFLCKRQSKGCS